MPDCVLRVAGSTSKVKHFLAECSFEPATVYFRGDAGFPKSRGPCKKSGFNISLSDSHGSSVEKQARQAVHFMETHRADFVRLASYGFKYTTLDFGLYDLATEERPWPTYRIPGKLIALAGEFGFDLVISFYGPP